MSLLEFGAKWFAAIAHALAYNRRKFTGEPYVVHCAEVVNELKQLNNIDKRIFAAAWLHDVVEDAGVSLELIKFLFGTQVYIFVWYMTDQATPGKTNRAIRKAMARQRFDNAPYPVQLMKLCDCYSNAKSIVVHDPDFWVTYRQEIKELISVFHPYDAHMDHGDFYLRLLLNYLLENSRVHG